MRKITAALGFALSLLANVAFAANSNLSNLSAGGAVSGTDLFYDVQSVGAGGVKVTGSQLATFFKTTPCTSTANSFQYNNTGAFGCVSGVTSNGTAITAAAIALGSDATGDVYYRNSSGNLTRLGIGSTGQLLTVNGGLPVWQIPNTTDYINVKTCGATGNGVTDDTSSINNCISQLNTAGSGVLYFPAGQYLVSSSLTTITANGVILGDGPAGITASTYAPVGQVSVINYTSATTAVFTITNNYGKFQNIGIIYTGGTTPSTGSAGILVTSTHAGQRVDYDTVMVNGFYIDVDVQTGTLWNATNISLIAPISIGMRINNNQICDAGDWSITNSQIVSPGVIKTPTGMYLQCGSAGKIVNTKFNSDGGMGIALDVEATAAATDLMIANSSFEGFNTTAIKIGNTSWPNITITGNQFGAGTGGSPTSVIDDNHGDTGVVITGNVFNNFTTPTAMIVGNATVTGNNTNNASTIPVTSSTSRFDFFIYTNSNPVESAIWTGTGTSGMTFEILGASSAGASGAGIVRALNNSSQVAEIASIGSSNTSYLAGGGGQIVQADKTMIVISDGTAASGGTDPISFRAGGTGAAKEVFQALAAGNLAFTNSANFTANGSTALSLTNIGPAGAHATVQKWLTITDGTSTFYIPVF